MYFDFSAITVIPTVLAVSIDALGTEEVDGHDLVPIIGKRTREILNDTGMDEWCLSKRIGEVALGEIQWLSSKSKTTQECDQDKDKEAKRIVGFKTLTRSLHRNY